MVALSRIQQSTPEPHALVKASMALTAVAMQLRTSLSFGAHHISSSLSQKRNDLETAPSCLTKGLLEARTLDAVLLTSSSTVEAPGLSYTGI